MHRSAAESAPGMPHACRQACPGGRPRRPCSTTHATCCMAPGGVLRRHAHACAACRRGSSHGGMPTARAHGRMAPGAVRPACLTVERRQLAQLRALMLLQPVLARAQQAVDQLHGPVHVLVALAADEHVQVVVLQARRLRPACWHGRRGRAQTRAGEVRRPTGHTRQLLQLPLQLPLQLAGPELGQTVASIVRSALGCQDGAGAAAAPCCGVVPHVRSQVLPTLLPCGRPALPCPCHANAKTGRGAERSPSRLAGWPPPLPLPRPRIMIRVRVSASMRFCVLPRGPAGQGSDPLRSAGQSGAAGAAPTCMRQPAVTGTFGGAHTTQRLLKQGYGGLSTTKTQTGPTCQARCGRACMHAGMHACAPMMSPM